MTYLLHIRRDKIKEKQKNMQKNMKHVAQNLPKAVYEDCVKEELEILKKAGEFGGKLCSKVTMEIIKDKLKIG